MSDGASMCLDIIRQGHHGRRPNRRIRVLPSALAALLMLLSSLLLVSIPSASAATPAIDLEFGEGFSSPFAVQDLKPGDLGTRTIVLRNAGSSDGEMAIWVSDIAETDHAMDGAHLDDYLLFEVRAEGLASNILMPGGISSFPTSMFGDGYLWILNVRAGQDLEVTWYWEFKETYTSQNEAQGDGLSFTINYLLGDMPPPRLEMSWLQVDVLGQVTTALMDSEGRTTESVSAEAGDGSVALFIGKGTRCYSSQDGQVQSIILTRTSQVRPTPDGQVVIGPKHVLSALTAEGEVSSPFLDSPAVLRINYDPALLPSITRMIGLYLYDGGGDWTPLPPEADAPSYIGQCTGQVIGPGEISVIATFEPQESAYFLPSDLSIEPSQTTFWDPLIFVKRLGDVVTVSVILTNIGEVSGARNVTLTINGQVVRSEQVSLDPLERTEVVFTVQDLEEGTYEIEVAGLSGQVSVGTNVNWWLIFMFSCLAIGAVVGFGYSARRWNVMRQRLNWLQVNIMDVESKLLESEMAIVALRERQKAAEIRTSDPANGNELASQGRGQVVPEPTTLQKTPKMVTSVPEIMVLPVELAVAPSAPSPMVGEDLHVAASIDNADRVEAHSELTAPAVMDALQLEQDLTAKKVQIAKDFILATIKEKGEISIDTVPRSKNAEIAMTAFSQLIDEGKLRAIQQQHRVIFQAME